MAVPHSHDLDGKLHDDCEMCDLIRELQPRASRENSAEQALERHRKVAERSRVGRDAIAKGIVDDEGLPTAQDGAERLPAVRGRGVRVPRPATKRPVRPSSGEAS